MGEAVRGDEFQELLLDCFMPKTIRIFTRLWQVSCNRFLRRFIPFVVQKVFIEFVEHTYLAFSFPLPFGERVTEA
jgi:hypothetical protein